MQSVSSAIAGLTETTGPEFIRPEAIQYPFLRLGLSHWSLKCGDRQFPSRSDIDIRELASVLSHTALVKVIDAGADFAFAVVGLAIARTSRGSAQGRRLTEVANNPRDWPKGISHFIAI